MSGRLYFNADHYHFDSSHTEQGETIKFETPNDQPIEIKSHLVSNSVQLVPKASAPTQHAGHNVLYTDNNDDLKLKKTDGSVLSIDGGSRVFTGTKLPIELDATGLPDNVTVLRVKDNQGFDVFKVNEDGHIKDNRASMAVFTGNDMAINYVVETKQSLANNTFNFWNLDQGGDSVNLMASSLVPDTNFTHSTNSDFNVAQFQGGTYYQYWTVARDMIVDIDVQIKLRSRTTNGLSAVPVNLPYSNQSSTLSQQLPTMTFKCAVLFYANEIFSPNLGAGGVYQHRLKTFERRLCCAHDKWNIWGGRQHWEINLRFQIPLYAMSWWAGSNGNQAGYNLRFCHNAATSANAKVGLQVEEIKWTLVKIADKPRI